MATMVSLSAEGRRFPGQHACMIPSPPQSMRSLRAVAFAVLVLGCTTGTAPGSGTGTLTLVAGASGTDTVDARLGQPLVAEVRDRKGDPLPNMEVRFASLSTVAPDGKLVAGALVGKLTVAGVGAVATDTSDALGHASVLVQ